MGLFYNVLIHIWLILNFITTIFCLYHACVAIACFRKEKMQARDGRQHRFAAVIAARNEELVIGHLVESIKRQDYPPQLIDVIVVADNCEDRTAEVAEKAGALVYKRFNKVGVGKGYVLKFIFEKIREERDIYDAYCIFDADNVVDRNFFKEMNRTLCAGYSIAQGYRDMKNPADTWVSGCHSLFYWMENRFLNYSRGVLGLSATLNGTGFMVTSDLIKETGFPIKTMTEDLEYTMISVLAGYKVGWVPEAIVYDEQPLTFGQSMQQRIRWTNGLMQCVGRYTLPFFKSMLVRPSWVTLDMFMFLAAQPILFASIGSGLVSFVLAALRIFDPVNAIATYMLLLVGSLLGFWLIAIGTLILEKKQSRELWKAVLTYPIFNFLWVVIYTICLFKRKVEWKPVVHVRSISISEMETAKVGK